jgi:hypothetical protein
MLVNDYLEPLATHPGGGLPASTYSDFDTEKGGHRYMQIAPPRGELRHQDEGMM